MPADTPWKIVFFDDTIKTEYDIYFFVLRVCRDETDDSRNQRRTLCGDPGQLARMLALYPLT